MPERAVTAWPPTKYPSGSGLMRSPGHHGEMADTFDGTAAVVNDDAQIIIGVSFDDPFRATEYLTEMSRLASLDRLSLRDAVIVSKDDSGDVRVRETIDPQPGRSALSGAAWTGLLGLILGGPVGWLAGTGIGAGVGALTAKVVDVGIPDEWVAWFRDAVDAGTTTVVNLFEEFDAGAYEREMGRFAGARLVHANLPTATLRDIRRAFGEHDLDGRGVDDGTAAPLDPPPASEPTPPSPGA